MKNVFYIVVCVYLICLSQTQIVQRKHIISLQTDNATHSEQLRQLEKIVIKYPLDHTRIESHVDLIGNSVFDNWEMASALYAKRGKE